MPNGHSFFGPQRCHCGHQRQRQFSIIKNWKKVEKGAKMSRTCRLHFFEVSLRQLQFLKRGTFFAKCNKSSTLYFCIYARSSRNWQKYFIKSAQSRLLSHQTRCRSLVKVQFLRHFLIDFWSKMAIFNLGQWQRVNLKFLRHIFKNLQCKSVFETLLGENALFLRHKVSKTLVFEAQLAFLLCGRALFRFNGIRSSGRKVGSSIFEVGAYLRPSLFRGDHFWGPFFKKGTPKADQKCFSFWSTFLMAFPVATESFWDTAHFGGSKTFSSNWGC